ncbi:MAG TPA: LysR substrate-binding domain-containing protein [Aestuariivirga sp.]|nr:LysR substrate-binding domain-containing protein [Aestuariivirga sp.]
MARRMPPFAALRAFEGAARLGSLRLSGEELSLSVSAISHQIKSLEEFLGITLFHRDKNKLRLTASGKDYLLELTRALDLIAAATAKIEQERHSNSVSVNLFASLAAMWLLPRLAKFRKLEPNIDVRVITTDDPIDFRTGLLDMAIRYADQPPDAAKTALMFKEAAFPVCSPSFREEFPRFDPASDLSRQTFITSQSSPDEWAQWFRYIGFSGKPPQHTIEFDSRALALEAAMDGLGVAMGRTPYMDRALAAGRLVRFNKRILWTGQCYFLAMTESAMRSKAARSFADWLVGQAGEKAG